MFIAIGFLSVFVSYVNHKSKSTPSNFTSALSALHNGFRASIMA